MSNKSKARAGGAFGGKKSGVKTQRRWITARTTYGRRQAKREPWSPGAEPKEIDAHEDEVAVKSEFGSRRIFQ
jgi:hypothetical protein